MGLRADDVNPLLDKCRQRLFRSGATTESLVRGTRNRKVGDVARHSFYIRLILLVAVLALASVLLGSEPWGPI